LASAYTAYAYDIKVDKLGLSCAKLSLNWGELDQLYLAKHLKPGLAK
jgi:hypothetical protein